MGTVISVVRFLFVLKCLHILDMDKHADDQTSYSYGLQKSNPGTIVTGCDNPKGCCDLSVVLK